MVSKARLVTVHAPGTGYNFFPSPLSDVSNHKTVRVGVSGAFSFPLDTRFSFPLPRPHKFWSTLSTAWWLLLALLKISPSGT